jgi:serine/threonine protein kinase
MEKGNLLKFMRENPVLFEDCVGMMIRACRGMVYLSDKKIVHRDLAARNILVKIIFFFFLVVLIIQNPQVNKFNVVKIRFCMALFSCSFFSFDCLFVFFPSHNQKKTTISDFGLARSYENFYNPHSESTIPVRWAAPEVLQQQSMTFKSDVFSFGVCMWEILSKGTSNLFFFFCLIFFHCSCSEHTLCLFDLFFQSALD